VIHNPADVPKWWRRYIELTRGPSAAETIFIDHQGKVAGTDIMTGHPYWLAIDDLKMFVSLEEGPGVVGVVAGDTIVLRKYAGVGTEVRHERQDYLIVDICDALLVIPA
jgi:hypothetical protein